MSGALNKLSKQVEVRNLISTHYIKLFSLLETKVKIPVMGILYQNLCVGWCFTTNSNCVGKGRIVVGWRPKAFPVDVL